MGADARKIAVRSGPGDVPDDAGYRLGAEICHGT